MGYPFIIVIIVQWDDYFLGRKIHEFDPAWFLHTKSGLENSHVIVDLPIKNCDFL